MSKKGGGPQAPEANNEFLMGAALLLFVVLGWYLLHTKVAMLILAIRLGESFIISLLTNNLDDLRVWMQNIDRRVVTISDLFMVSQEIGAYIRWITAPILGFLGYKLFNSSPSEKFKRVYSDKTLPPEVADLFPWMKISTKIDFAKMDPEVGPWAYAKTERSFAREFKLKNERGEYDAARAEEVFSKQIGPMWVGYKNLKPHAKALFAMLAARINKDFKTSDIMLRHLADSASTGKIDYTGVDELAEKYMDSKPLKRIFRQHAYENTVLMQMLDAARGGDTGKDYLPPNWFLWLKGVDRKLWYAMSDVGRRTFHVESAGVIAHWLTERARKKALQMPFVRNAVEGLENELKKFTEDGDRDMTDEDEALEIRNALPLVIPTPEQAELMRQQRAISGGAGGARNNTENDQD